MASATAGVERSLYSTTETWLLERAIKGRAPAGEREIAVILETVRAGAVVAEYAIRAAQRGSKPDAVVDFGFLMHLLWEASVPKDASRSIALAYLGRALVTLAAFAPTTQNSKHPKIAALGHSSGTRGSGSQLIRLGRRAADEIGFDSVEMASRARKPWAALLGLSAVADEPFDFSPYVQSPRYVSSLMNERLEKLGDLRQAAITWRTEAGDAADELVNRHEGGTTPAAIDPLPELAEVRWTDDDPQAWEIEAYPAAIDPTSGQFVVWYGTDREPRGRDTAFGYANHRDPQGVLHYGRCVVNIPVAHKFGSIGSPRWKGLLSPKESDRLQLLRVVPCGDGAEFASLVGSTLESNSPPDRRALVYVHGYATTFKQAAVRAAQIGFDLKADGVTAFYSWPSAGAVLAYLKDTTTVEASEHHFVTFLMNLAEKSNVTRVDLIVHSMGNRLVARSLQQVAARLAPSGVRLGAIVLAAPDIDVNVFKMLAGVYPQIGTNTTMYVSRKDRALDLSKTLWRGDRAGFTPPITIEPDIHTIEVTDIDVSRLGHGYYAAAAPVLYDIREVLSGRYDPSKRLRLKTAGTGHLTHWIFSP